ncbi:MAG: hypothetical protein QNJ43_23895 [Breoghania sp.]|nr:hypothetical protein [Breoghania sp.]
MPENTPHVSTEADGVIIENTAAAFDIDLGAVSPSDVADITVSGLTDRMKFSAGKDNGDGSWKLAAEDLDGLTLTATDPGPTVLQVQISVRDAKVSTSTTSSFDVSVKVLNVAEAPGLSVRLGGGALEEAETPLTIQLSDLTATEMVAITIDGVGNDDELTAGTLNPDGSYTLDLEDLVGLAIIPHSSADLDLTIVANVTDTTTDTMASVSDTVHVAVIPDMLT